MYAEINTEISEYKEQLFLGMTLEQIIICICGILCEVGAYFLFCMTLDLPDFWLTLIYVVIALPFGGLLVVKYNKMGFAKLCAVLFRYYFMQDLHLKFTSSNRWRTVLDAEKTNKGKEDINK